MSRIIALDCITYHIINLLIHQSGGKLLSKVREKIQFIAHQSRIDFAIRQAPVNAARACLDLLKNPCCRMQSRFTRTTGAVRENEHGWACQTEPMVDTQLMAGMRDYQGCPATRQCRRDNVVERLHDM